MIITMVVICAEVGIVMCYFTLCRENHAWWWRAFWSTASCGLYIYIYCALYANTQLQLTGLTALLIYHCYMGMASIAVGLMTGAVGFLAAMWFVFQIFGSLKFD